MESPAEQALTPRSGAYAQGSATLMILTVYAAQDRMDETVVVEAVEDADMEAVTIMHSP